MTYEKYKNPEKCCFQTISLKRLEMETKIDYQSVSLIIRAAQNTLCRASSPRSSLALSSGLELR